MNAKSNGELMLQMVRRYWVSQIVGTLARLNIPDCLSAAEPVWSKDIATEIACDPDATYRLLRASAGVGLVLELSEGRFSITELGKTLRADVPGSMRDFALALTAPGHWLPWAVWPTWHDPESGKHRRHLASNFSTITTKIPPKAAPSPAQCPIVPKARGNAGSNSRPMSRMSKSPSPPSVPHARDAPKRQPLGDRPIRGDSSIAMH